ncbi:MAG: hydroxyphenylacetyl-CoA thioesterase PaaI [Candidatus Bathyarchaeota archaeon]|nr:hydroxyphenylacetyl-CoA thioesterase PaaI [Candidatus Bathyarchaeota archaeon]
MKDTDHFAEELGIQLLESKDGYAKVQLKIAKKHTNAHGFTHGGAIFSLADYAFAHACNFGDNVAVALQVSINYLKPSVEGDLLTAEATRVSDGKTTGLYQVTVKNQEKTVALFTGLAYKK